MIQASRKLIFLSKLAFVALLPTLLLTGIRWLGGTGFVAGAFISAWLLVSGALWIGYISQPNIEDQKILYLYPSTGFLILVTLGLGVLSAFQEYNWSAWLFLGGVYALLLGLVSSLSSKTTSWQRILIEGEFTLVAGLLPVLLVQINTRFSTEEFYVALESVTLMIFWLSLRGAYAYWRQGRRNSENKSSSWQVNRRWLLAGLSISAIIGSAFTVWDYQSSFFPDNAPGFPGVSIDNPFVCGKVPPSEDAYTGSDVFQDLVNRVETNPTKGSPEYGFLTLATGEKHWARSFRESMLKEVENGKFTGPGGSVKFGQYLSSQRAYYYPRVLNAFPELFSPSEEKAIADWFAAINQRALTVEWVDWTYALALRYWPQGPYENQENGAGLLALLENNHLSNPDLSPQNQQYLLDNQRGWESNFRVTDDAAVYQPEWMENAWFQSMYHGESNLSNQQRSFEWLKILAPPDGSQLRYNHLGAVRYANVAYWGARLLGDENLLWLSGRALENLYENQIGLSAQPGTEHALRFMGISPTVGSCLVYANSGLPTQKGPLAPDKLVFRSGWETDDIYLLLNLRFTGWHRYKATNAIVQLYQNEPLVIENYSGETFDWLPTGRSLFRDKRIPRENLNGLVIPKTDLAAVLYNLTGIGGPWAQDPPFYAEVKRFESESESTISSTLIEDWHGWRHQRTIWFYPQGIIAVFDDAQGPQGNRGALIWHLVGEAVLDGKRIPLGKEKNRGTKPEAVLLPIHASQPELHPLFSDENKSILRVQYKSTGSASMKTATVFLFDDWVGARIEADDQIVTISQGEQQIEINLAEIFDG